VFLFEERAVAERHVLILRLYSSPQSEGAAAVGVCEDPLNGKQTAFHDRDALWRIVQAKLSRSVASRTRNRATATGARTQRPDEEEP
jgi:hypothetical protein